MAKKTTAKSAGKSKSTAKKTVAKSKVGTKKVAKASAKPKATPTAYKGPKLGEKLKSFELQGTSGSTITPASFNGKITVLYFYPKDNTPGCTLEGYDFKALSKKFEKAGTQIFGISRDSLKSHEGFKEKCGFPFELLTDDKDQLAKIFDVIQMKQLYGRKFEGIERSTFVLDQEGRLKKEWRKVKVDGHAAAVLKFIEDGMAE